jgi:hypothetical protein
LTPVMNQVRWAIKIPFPDGTAEGPAAAGVRVNPAP